MILCLWNDIVKELQEINKSDMVSECGEKSE